MKALELLKQDRDYCLSINNDNLLLNNMIKQSKKLKSYDKATKIY